MTTVLLVGWYENKLQYINISQACFKLNGLIGLVFEYPACTGAVSPGASCVKAPFSLLTTRGWLLWLYRSICFMCWSCILSPDHKGVTPLAVQKYKLHVLKLHSLSWSPGGDSSGCIEVYASCVKAVFSLLITRRRLLWLRSISDSTL